jgi:dTDP-4-amino-4,6-dideoxygalactose transaminase
MLRRYVVPDMPSADELLPYLRQIDKNRWYSNFGPLVTQFENRLLAFLAQRDEVAGAPPLALTSVISCYHALTIGLQLFRLPQDAKVLVPAVTFPACPLAVRHAKAEPVLADIDGESWQLTPEIARRAAKAMPIHAVMPVAIYGAPAPVEGWDAFTKDTGIPVIIDAAAALESQSVPQNGIVAHSLHATKPFSVGEGGVLVSRNQDYIAEARRISNFGTQERITVQDGCNAKLSEYHGAVSLAQLDRWAQVKQRRRHVFDMYRQRLADARLDLHFQPGIDNVVLGSLMLCSPLRDAAAIAEALSARGIMAHRMYLPPLYQHPHFAGLDCVSEAGVVLKADAEPQQKRAHMKNSEAMQRNVFGLPFHAFLDEGDIDYVTNALIEIMDTSSVEVPMYKVL